jgi:ubiquinone/menaquinone biosynthesis C-methylase UbiE
MTTGSSESVFDNLAPNYDAAFSNRLPGMWLRDRVRKKIAALIPAGAKIVDIGCGTGVDAIWFAAQGHTVLATDISDGMLTQARMKIAELPPQLRDKITLARELQNKRFDFAVSNFGALNCISDLRPVLEDIDQRTKPGAHVALVLMGRFCLLETIGFLLRGQFRRAGRRWSGSSVYTNDGVSQPVWYHSPSSVRNMAQDGFDVIRIDGIGVALPPSEFFHVCERHPRLFHAMCTLEVLFSASWPFSRMGDHYLIVLQKRAAEVG